MECFIPSKQTFTNPFFIGTVEDNKDPENNYRVKVRVDELHPSTISTENLPWAAKVDSSFMGMSDSAPLNHNVPEIGSKVLLIAVANDPNSLLYIGILYHKTPQTPSGDSYGGSYGIYMSGGQFIGIDKINKAFQMIYEGHINIDKILDSTIKVTNGVNIECDKANIKASSVKIDAANTNITGKLKIDNGLEVDGTVKFNNYASGAVKDTYPGGSGYMVAVKGVITNADSKTEIKIQ